MPTDKNPVTLRRATPDDAARLALLAAQTFRDTYAGDNTPADMAQHLAEHFSEQLQRAELEDGRCHTILAESGDDGPVGYALLREGPSPDCVGDPDAVEIVRIYVKRSHIGSGVGGSIMRGCIDLAAMKGKHTIWLGVWERNTRALGFYTRWGFVDRGTQTFTLGSDRQTDRVMSRLVKEHG